MRNYRGLRVRLMGMELRSCHASPRRSKDWVEVDSMASVEDRALASRTREMRVS